MIKLFTKNSRETCRRVSTHRVTSNNEIPLDLNRQEKHFSFDVAINSNKQENVKNARSRSRCLQKFVIFPVFVIRRTWFSHGDSIMSTDKAVSKCSLLKKQFYLSRTNYGS